MTAKGGAREWVKQHNYVISKCPECNGRIEGAEQPNGIWCEASLLVEKTSPIGLRQRVATCETSVRTGVCNKRSHTYQCTNCHWTIIIE